MLLPFWAMPIRLIRSRRWNFEAVNGERTIVAERVRQSERTMLLERTKQVE